ncbi:MAG: 1-acyl-sn-glycerol-3-phosphate acyltransferase [Defluviitaleaceae bacterium]|nr:1-acyl-sn-glycerol-3-phosphate acyltransferase [Defluviitaleaceae bacterium]
MKNDKKDFIRSRWLYWIVRNLAVVVYRLIFRIRVRGVENIPRDEGIILCANHTSMHDVPLLAVVCPRKVHFIAKDELFAVPILGRIFWRLGAVPINREKPTFATLKACIAILKEGRAMGIFLQGGRRENLEADEAKSGVALFAIKGRARVVPIHINPEKRFRFFSRVIVNIGEPIDLSEYYESRTNAELLSMVAQKIMGEIARLGEGDE